jgi:hypothetical protein
MLLGNILLHRSLRKLGVLDVDLLGLPNKLLQKVSLVLGQKQKLGLLDNVAEVGHQPLAFLRELFRRSVQRARLQNAVQRNVDLFVLDASAG